MLGCFAAPVHRVFVLRVVENFADTGVGVQQLPLNVGRVDWLHQQLRLQLGWAKAFSFWESNVSFLDAQMHLWVSWGKSGDLSFQLPTVASLILPLCWSRSETKHQKVSSFKLKKIWSPGWPKKDISKVEGLDLSSQQEMLWEVAQNWKKKTSFQASETRWLELNCFDDLFFLFPADCLPSSTHWHSWSRLGEAEKRGFILVPVIIKTILVMMIMINQLWWGY